MLPAAEPAPPPRPILPPLQPATRQTPQQLIDQHRTSTGIDTQGLARDVATLRASDPAGADALRNQVAAQLTPVQRGEFARAVDQAPATPAPAANDSGPDPVQLGLDLGQMALDITGIVDPTPISDGSNALISVGRSIGSLFSGNFSEAGGHALNAGISAVGIVPGLGDLAKAGKIGKWVETVGEATRAIAHNPALRGALEPALKKLAGVLDKIPEGALNALPASTRDSIAGMKRDLKATLDGPPPAGAVRAAGDSAKIGRNSAEWTLDASGRPTHASATLSELQPAGTPRGKAETDATKEVGNRGLPDDDGGHIIGHRFMGDQGARNMFPQNFNFNRSAYKTMENEWAGWIEKGGTVKVNVDLLGGSAGRPAQVGVSYEVFNAAGKRVFDNQALFDNAAGQVFNRVPSREIADIMAR